MNASVPPREDMAHMASDTWIVEMKRIVYLIRLWFDLHGDESID
jgi:hypothetical protein